MNGTLHSEKSESAGFKFGNSFSKLQRKSYLNNAFLIPNLKLFLHETLYFDKLGGVDLKYDNCFRKFKLYHMPEIAKYGIFGFTSKV